jgi:lysophospholipase L1-like esterase
VPNLAANANVLNNLRNLHKAGRGTGIKANEVAFIGDSGLAGVRSIKLGQLRTEQPILNGLQEFYAQTFGNGINVSSIADQPASFTAFSLIDQGKGANACAGKAPINCAVENRVAVVFILVGRDDIALNRPIEEFTQRLDEAVKAAEAGQVIPVLATIPGLLNPAENAKLEAFNQVIIETAKAHNIPVVNLYAALNADPNPPKIVNGAPTVGGEEPGSNFTGAGMQFGINRVNDALLRTLEAIRTQVLSQP